MTVPTHDMKRFSRPDDIPLITTEHFVLRPLRAADAAAIFRVFSDPEVARYWGHPALAEIEDAESFIRQAREGVRSGELLEWGVTEKGRDEVIGTCAFSNWVRAHRRAEIGFGLRRDRWGEGIMSEVLPALVRFGFVEMGLHRIEADVDPRNTRSIRALERLGFVREGYQRERYHVSGELQDSVLFGLLRHEYE
ncbi:MAG: GNAT family N-acetyltransferase [Acidobacteria bacterium]|nr:GNAT family N-acetyltransferase [Acidobacteriota bacterium]